jgi:hypothetical protein
MSTVLVGAAEEEGVERVRESRSEPSGVGAGTIRRDCPLCCPDILDSGIADQDLVGMAK